MSFLFLYFLDAISQPNRDRRWKLKPESDAELGEIQSTLDAPNGRCGWNRQPRRPTRRCRRSAREVWRRGLQRTNRYGPAPAPAIVPNLSSVLPVQSVIVIASR